MRARLLLRQAASSLGASLTVVLIVAVAAGLLAAWPRLARATFVDEVTYRIAETPRTARALTGSQTGTWLLGPAGTTVTAVERTLDDAVAGTGAALRPMLGTPQVLIELTAAGDPDIAFTADTPRPSDLAGVSVRFRSLPTLAEHIDVADGEPAAAWEVPGFGDTPADPGAPVPPIPVMFSVATAERLGVGVGSVLDLQLGMPVPVEGDQALAQAVVTGLFQAKDPQEQYWEHQISGLVPLIRTDPNLGDFALGAAYVDPGTAALLGHSPGLVPTTDVWIPVEPTGADPAALLDDLRDTTADAVTLGEPGPLGIAVEVELDSALVEVLDTAIVAQRGTAAVLTLVAAGPVGVTFALVALATRLSVSRRRPTLALASARGGSGAQIRAALAAEGLVLGLPAAAVGVAVATAAVPGPTALGDHGLPLLVALSPAVFLAAESLPTLRPQRHDLSGRSTSRWRWVAEAVVVLLAAGAVYLLLSRGLQATTTTAVDPLATGTPLLVALATAVVATRLFPVPMRAVHAVTRRRRDLAAFLGSARALREGVAGFVPMLALLVATSIAVFSTSMLTTLATGVERSTQSSAGADVRLVGPAYQDDAVGRMAALDGVAATARVFTQNQTPYTVGTTTRQLALHLVDTSVLARVQADVPDAVALPAGMDVLVDGAVPVVVSSSLRPEDPGAAVTLRMDRSVDVAVVGTAAAAPGIAGGALWAIADLELMREVTSQNLVPRMVLVELAPDADVDAVVAGLTDVVEGQGTIAPAATEQSEYLRSPSAVSMQRGFVVALALSVVQSVLALVLTLVLAAPARGRLVAVLRTLGTGPRQSRRLVAWELVPLAAMALVVGVGLGLVLPSLVVRTTDLSAFTGLTTPAVVHDWPRLGLVVAVVAAVVAATLAIASAVARRLSLSVLRIGDAT